MSDYTLVRGDIIQITDSGHPWFPCLLIVDEVESWGVQAYATIPESNDGSKPYGQAYNRLKFEQIEKVGSALFVAE